MTRKDNQTAKSHYLLDFFLFVLKIFSKQLELHSGDTPSFHDMSLVDRKPGVRAVILSNL